MDWEKEKCLHEAIPVPEALDGRVHEAIRQGRAVRRRRQLRRGLRRGVAGLVSAAACLTVAVNASPAFARGLGDVPGLGALVRVICVRSDVWEENGTAVSVRVPGLEGENTEEVNALIQKQVDAYVEQATAEIDAYRQAFIQTGGTEEEFNARGIDVQVDYEIKAQTEDYISFVLTGFESWNASTVVHYYYNLRLSDGSPITLEDVLGENWVEVANASIRGQIDAHNQSNEIDYLPAEEGFQTVTTSTDFYLDAAGRPVVVFDKYEIAPGALGEPQFVIPLPA